MGWTSTQAVGSVTRWKTRDPYSFTLVEQCHFQPDNWELTLGDTGAGINGVYLRQTKETGVIFKLLNIPKKLGSSLFK